MSQHGCLTGLTLDAPVVEEVTNYYGNYFKATAKIGTVFGAEVEGEITGIGRTREIALQRLEEERHKTAEALWA